MKFEEGHYYKFKFDVINETIVAKQTIRTNNYALLGPHIFLNGNSAPDRFENEYSLRFYDSVAEVSETYFNQYVIELFERRMNDILNDDSIVYLNKDCLYCGINHNAILFQNIDNIDNLSITYNSIGNTTTPLDIVNKIDVVNNCVRPLFKKLNDRLKLCDEKSIKYKWIMENMVP
jgi:hypothetical protein